MEILGSDTSMVGDRRWVRTAGRQCRRCRVSNDLVSFCTDFFDLFGVKDLRSEQGCLEAP